MNVCGICDMIFNFEHVTKIQEHYDQDKGTGKGKATRLFTGWSTLLIVSEEYRFLKSLLQMKAKNYRLMLEI